MKRATILTSTLLAAAAGGLSLSPLAAQDAGGLGAEAKVESSPMTRGEAKLAKLLEGRVAGEPVRCIRTLPNQRMQTIDRTAYVYGSGETIYVQRTRNPENIDNNDALVINRFNASELCRLDITTSVDRTLGVFTGAVFFEDFVPYTRAKGDAAEG